MVLDQILIEELEKDSSYFITCEKNLEIYYKKLEPFYKISKEKINDNKIKLNLTPIYENSNTRFLKNLGARIIK